MTFEWSNAFWVLQAALTALVVLRLLRSRRREMLSGSLLIWKRLAAKETARPTRTFKLDRSFWLQAAALGALGAALSGPVLEHFSQQGRRIAVVLDNGPAARARMPDGKRVWDQVVRDAHDFLSQLDAADQVELLVSSPLPRRLKSGGARPLNAALAELDRVQPALSGPDTLAVWRYALEYTGEQSEQKNATEPLDVVVVCSPRVAPPGARDTTGERTHWLVSGNTPELSNVALTAVGSTALQAKDEASRAVEVLVRVSNFSAHPALGHLELHVPAASNQVKQSRSLEIPAGTSAGVAFRIEQFPLPTLRIEWSPVSNAPDALLEDNSIVLAPQAQRLPLVRMNGNAPHVEDLWASTGGTQFLREEDPRSADLEVYVDAVPHEVPATARAAIFFAPAASFGPFEVAAASVSRPVAFRCAHDDPLTRGSSMSPEGLGFPILRARRFSQWGDWQPLLRDSDGNVLAARFRLSAGRTGYVFAFVPGDGWPRERKLEPPAFPALLLRLLSEATRMGEPYSALPVAVLERPSGEPLPPDWSPQLAEDGQTGTGVLDVHASNLSGVYAARIAAPLKPPALLSTRRTQPSTLALLFSILALTLIVIEMHLEPASVRTPSADPKHSSLPVS